MSYCINLGDWGSIFAIPSSVVDKHIKLVGSSQLKVLLWILRNSGNEFSLDDISLALSLHREDVKDAVGYWIESGIIKLNGENLANKEKNNGDNTEKIDKSINLSQASDDKNAKLCDKKDVITKIPRRVLLPDSSYINERIKTSEDIKFLMQEAQLILGRPISTGDSAILLMLNDNDGLPVDVILMIIQYAVGIGRHGMKYIEAVGRNWASEGIDTIEKAEKKIKSLSSERMAWNKFEKIACFERRAPTEKEMEAVNRWFNLWKYTPDMVKEAYEICINSNGKYVLKYIDSIITRWHKNGLYTIDQVHAEKKSINLRISKEKRKPSYNIDEYEKNYNIYDEIKWGEED